MRLRWILSPSRVALAFYFAIIGVVVSPAESAGDQLGFITFAPAIEKALPAVVSIAVKGHRPIEQSPLYRHPLFRRFGLQRTSAPPSKEFVSAGSGVIVDGARGLVLSNVHTLAKADEIKVQLADGREFIAEVVGMEPPTDVAVLRIAGSDLPSLPIGDSELVRTGDIIIAIGAPFGLQGTATMGMVSAVMRSGIGYESYESFIQIDAAVNSGNSGGPLINQRGELIGINTAILSPDDGNVGVGFAIPINMAHNIMDALVASGRIRRGHIGMRTRDLTPELVKTHHLPVLVGAFITHVQDQSPAGKAGLAANEVVIAFDGNPVRHAADLATRIAGAPVGSSVDLEIANSAGRRHAGVAITELKLEPERLVLPASVPRLNGVVLASIEPGSPMFGDVKGAEVTQVKAFSRAAFSGLAVGDIIVKLDGYKVRAPEDVIKLTKGTARAYTIEVLRAGVPIHLKMR